MLENKYQRNHGSLSEIKKIPYVGLTTAFCPDLHFMACCQKTDANDRSFPHFKENLRIN